MAFIIVSLPNNKLSGRSLSVIKIGTIAPSKHLMDLHRYAGKNS